jgi:hypothetical protein
MDTREVGYGDVLIEVICGDNKPRYIVSDWMGSDLAAIVVTEALEEPKYIVISYISWLLYRQLGIIRKYLSL